MICPKCGREFIGTNCPFCNSNDKTKELKISIKNFMRQTSTKIIAAIWTVCWIFNIIEMRNELNFWQAILIIMFGYIIYIPLGHFIIRLVKNHKIIKSVKLKYNIEISNSKIPVSFDNMEGHEFEYFCADVLRSNGFTNIEVTKGSGDQGIDILAEKDGIKYAIQCKCYNSDIGNKAVQEAFSGKTFYNCHVAVVMTNRYFTPAAKQLAEKNGVILWNRDKLNSMVLNMK